MSDATKTIRLLALNFYALIVTLMTAKPELTISTHRNLELVIYLLINGGHIGLSTINLNSQQRS